MYTKIIFETKKMDQQTENASRELNQALIPLVGVETHFYSDWNKRNEDTHSITREINNPLANTHSKYYYLSLFVLWYITTRFNLYLFLNEPPKIQ